MSKSTAPIRSVAAASTAKAGEPTLFSGADGEPSAAGGPATGGREHVPQDTPPTVADSDGEWPWPDETADAVDLLVGPTEDEASPTAEAEPGRKPNAGEPMGFDRVWQSDDQGAAKDIILSHPQPAVAADTKAADTSGHDTGSAAEPPSTVTGKPMPKLPPRGDIASLGVRKPGVAPKQIGSGRLVPARLTWKPGDPFAGSKKTKPNQFRWEVMLTSACVTAACGLGCIWLLRTILA